MASGQQLRYSKDHSFFDRSLSVRIFIACLFGLGLFLFLHFREVRVEVLQLGEISPRYIVAQIPFSFPDEEATTILRQEALLDIGRIYAIDSDNVNKRKLDFENILIYDQEWRKNVKLSTFDEIYKAAEKLSRFLLEARFCDGRTIKKLHEMGFSTKNYFEIALFDMSQGAHFPDKVWDSIVAHALDKELFHQETVDVLNSFYKDKIWVMKFDLAAEKKLQKAIREEIPITYTQVMAGSRIIDQGDKVSSRHLAMMEAMKAQLAEKKNLTSPKTILSSLAITALIMMICYLFLLAIQPEVFSSNKMLFLLVSIVFLGMGLAKISEFVLLKTTENLFEIVSYPLLVPVVAILVCCLVNPVTAIFVSTVCAVLFDIALAFDRPGFLMTNLFVALFAILYTKTLHKRTEIFIVCGKAWLASVVLICALYFYDNSHFNMALTADLISAGLFMLLTAVLVVGLLPIFESCFRVLTDITLMEYMDPNHELLRRLVVEAPGTYQHALIMGNIAEAAARAVYANGLFCRVATLYHDIGKLNIAQYFTENQQQGTSIHQLLTPVESAQVIISHVNEGVAIARKAGLPEQFINVIKEHHGTSLVYYFYHEQLKRVGGRKDLVNEKEFRYSGPKAHSKESIIIMIVDSVEAASRSLDEVNEATLTKMVDQIVREKLDDGQLDDCELSFEELGRVKKAIIKCLLSIGHFRVKYPERIRNDEAAIEAGKA